MKIIRIMHGYLVPFSSSSRFSSATLTASITKAVNVQVVPEIAFSTSSIKSFGNRMLLLVVGGIDGISNFFIIITNTIVHITVLIICITFVLHS